MNEMNHINESTKSNESTPINESAQVSESPLPAKEAQETLEEQNRRLWEENERLKREQEEYRKSLPIKERLYDHVNVSLKTMDRIIAALFILLGIVLVMGIINR